MAWKNFQNGYPLYASELNNYLMNQAVVVFASAGERSTTIPSPTEGMVTWLQDANTFQVFNGTDWVDVAEDAGAIQKSTLTTQGDLIVRNGTEPVRLALGTSGQVLSSNGTTAVWSAPSAPSKVYTQLGTATLTGAPIITISGISGKDDLMVVVVDASSVNAASLITVNFNTASFTNGGSSATYTASYGGSVFNQFSQIAGSGINLGQMSNNAASLVGGYAYLSGANSTGSKIFHAAGGSSSGGGNTNRAYTSGGFTDSVGAITSVSVSSATGNFDSGTIYVYGA